MYINHPLGGGIRTIGIKFFTVEHPFSSTSNPIWLDFHLKSDIQLLKREFVIFWFEALFAKHLETTH